MLQNATVIKNKGMGSDGKGNSELMKWHRGMCNRVSVVNKHWLDSG